MSMISELVDRLRTEAKSMGAYGTSYMATLLMRSADTIEMLSKKAREPKQGEWIAQNGGGFRCSECNHYALDEIDGRFIHVAFKSNFCPYCGARMKGADDE